jgi:hypothetical protein
MNRFFILFALLLSSSFSHAQSLNELDPQERAVLAANSIEEISALFQNGHSLFNSPSHLKQWKMRLKWSDLLNEMSVRSIMLSGEIILESEQKSDSSPGRSYHISTTKVLTYDRTLKNWSIHEFPVWPFCNGYYQDTRILGQWKGGYIAWCGIASPDGIQGVAIADDGRPDEAYYLTDLVLLDQDFKIKKRIKYSTWKGLARAYFTQVEMESAFGKVVSTPSYVDEYLEGKEISDSAVAIEFKKLNGGSFKILRDGTVLE